MAEGRAEWRRLLPPKAYEVLFEGTPSGRMRAAAPTRGHVFDGGRPPPTGQRWCNNGLALRFVPEGEPLPPLRS